MNFRFVLYKWGPNDCVTSHNSAVERFLQIRKRRSVLKFSFKGLVTNQGRASTKREGGGMCSFTPAKRGRGQNNFGVVFRL